MNETGKVKWFNHSKGFGFIIPDGGGVDVFMHASSLSDPDYEPREGDGVSFVKENAKKPGQFKASNVRRTIASNHAVEMSRAPQYGRRPGYGL